MPTYATDVATSHGLSTSVASNIPVAAYGVVLILVMLIFPQGIQGGALWLLRLSGSPLPHLAWNPTRKKALNEEIPSASRASHRRRGDGRARCCRVQLQLEHKLELRPIGHWRGR